jgi:hypothetical protein
VIQTGQCGCDQQAHWPLKLSAIRAQPASLLTLQPWKIYSSSENKKKHRKNDELKQAWKLQTSTRLYHNLVCSWAVSASSSTLNLKPCKEKRIKKTKKKSRNSKVQSSQAFKGKTLKLQGSYSKTFAGCSLKVMLEDHKDERTQACCRMHRNAKRKRPKWFLHNALTLEINVFNLQFELHRLLKNKIRSPDSRLQTSSVQCNSPTCRI